MDSRLIYTGMVLGALLVLAGVASERRDLKKHFEFTYSNFGVHILFIAGLAGLFRFDRVNLLWFLLLSGIAVVVYLQALKKKSFYFMLIVILYMYIALSYVVVDLLWSLARKGNDGIGAVYLGFFYFILSAIGVVRLLIILNRKMKTHDSL